MVVEEVGQTKGISLGFFVGWVRAGPRKSAQTDPLTFV